MPSEREMAEAYISQVENQLEQLKDNVSKLESHLNECRKELEEKKDDKFLQDVESTGEWTDYTITQLQKKKDTLMKKEKRTAAEVKTVRQLNFAINAKQGDYKKKD